MIQVTKQAAEKIKAFKKAQNAEDDQTMLRLGVKGGGCSGFQYQLAFDHATDKDQIFESEGEKIIVDQDSLPYVDGSTIIYREENLQSGFDVENPNATTACGCGSSFRVDGKEGCSEEAL